MSCPALLSSFSTSDQLKLKKKKKKITFEANGLLGGGGGGELFSYMRLSVDNLMVTPITGRREKIYF
jgi:hypothetical protein